VVKPHVRKIESAEGVLIVDDSIAEKPYTDENDIICWHYDHSQQRNVKGINFVTCLYHSVGISLPVGFELIAKTEHYTDPKDGKEKRRSPKTKSEYYREMTQQAVHNQILFKYVLNDVCFSAADNMVFVKNTLKKDFVMPLKSNRKVAWSPMRLYQTRTAQMRNQAQPLCSQIKIVPASYSICLRHASQIQSSFTGCVR
jgi:hypothetical protein